MIGWGTVTQIALYTGRPARTIRDWARRGLIPSACDRRTKALMVEARAAREQAQTRQMRART